MLIRFKRRNTPVESNPQGWEHDQEGTHYVCDERLRKLGGKATCCGCDGHKCSDAEPAMEIEAQEAHKPSERIDDNKSDGLPRAPIMQMKPAPHPEAQEALTHKDHIAQAEAATYADALVSVPHPEATQGEDDTFDEAFHEWLQAHGGTLLEANDKNSRWTLDLNKLKLAMLVWRDTTATRMAVEARIDELKLNAYYSQPHKNDPLTLCGIEMSEEQVNKRIAALQVQLKNGDKS